MIRLSLRSEPAFKQGFIVEVTSSDANLLFETRGTRFDDASMANGFGSAGVSIPGKTWEVGVGKKYRGAEKCRHVGKPIYWMS